MTLLLYKLFGVVETNCAASIEHTVIQHQETFLSLSMQGEDCLKMATFEVYETNEIIKEKNLCCSSYF